MPYTPAMLYQPERHEPLIDATWDETQARDALRAIVRDAEIRFDRSSYWPLHAKDVEPNDAQPALPLYHGATGVIWALHYLHDVGAVSLSRRYDEHLDTLLIDNREWLASVLPGTETAGAFLMGDTPLLMMSLSEQQHFSATADRLAQLIEGNIEHPARELMWGSPGTLLAALFLCERFGDVRWAGLFRRTAARLRSQLEWSSGHGCHYWTQDLYGTRSTYLDAVHGFAATAFVLIKGRELLEDWTAWQDIIATTVAQTATREGPAANWRAQLTDTSARLMQFCHGAPGFVVCLAQFPSPALDELLIAAGEATWMAGPLVKGSNLCHGTGGNGYAFLKLFERTGNPLWLDRARRFAMHGIRQMQSDERQYGQLRYSLWTGDPGFAIYLWDCIRAAAAFPTLDVFFARS